MTAMQELFDWVNEIDNSIFALSASPVELKMLGSFKTKLASFTQKEKQQLMEAYNQGYRDGELDVPSTTTKDVSEFSNAEQYYSSKYEQK